MGNASRMGNGGFNSTKPRARAVVSRSASFKSKSNSSGTEARIQEEAILPIGEPKYNRIASRMPVAYLTNSLEHQSNTDCIAASIKVNLM